MGAALPHRCVPRHEPGRSGEERTAASHGSTTVVLLRVAEVQARTGAMTRESSSSPTIDWMDRRFTSRRHDLPRAMATGTSGGSRSSTARPRDRQTMTSPPGTSPALITVMRRLSASEPSTVRVSGTPAVVADRVDPPVGLEHEEAHVHRNEGHAVMPHPGSSPVAVVQRVEHRGGVGARPDRTTARR